MPKVKVWRGVMKYRVIESLFLSEKTIKGIHLYLKTLISYCFPLLVELKNNEQTHFQKDIARPPALVHFVTNAFDEKFGHHRQGPPRSPGCPYLTPRYFLLCRYMKNIE